MIVEYDELVDAMNNTQAFLKKKNDWEEILFREWEMSPLQQLFYVNLAENDDAFADAVTNDVSKEFTEYIKYRIVTHANVNVILVGEQGSGKSTFGATIFLYTKKQTQILRQIDLGHWHLTFTTAETLDAYNKLERSAMIFQDEDDELQGQGSRSIISKLGNIIKRVRAWEIGLLICCPVLTTIPGCDYAILPFGFHRAGAEHFRNTGDPSKCYARALLYVKSKFQRDQYKLQGCVFFFTGDAIKYMVESGYHEAKKASFEKVKKNYGGSGAYTAVAIKNLKEQAKQLAKVAIKLKWDGKTKKDLETYLLETEIRPTVDELKHIKKYAIQYFEKYQARKEKRKGNNKKPAADANAPPVKEFLYDLEPILEAYLKEAQSKDPAREVEIYRASLDPLKKGEYFVKAFKISPARVTQLKEKVAGFINRKKGHLYEAFDLPRLQSLYDTVIHDGGIGKPDFLCQKGDDYVLYSHKCLAVSRGSLSISYGECKPEIEEAQKLAKLGKKVSVILRVYNEEEKAAIEHQIPQSIIDNQEPYASFKKKAFNFHPEKENETS